MSAPPSTTPAFGARAVHDQRWKASSSSSNASATDRKRVSRRASPASSADAQVGRRVEEVRRRELQLDRRPLRDDADLLAVGGVVGQEVPADREAGVIRRAGPRSTTDGGHAPSGQTSTASIATGSPANARMTASSWTMLPSTMFAYSRPSGRRGRPERDRLEPVRLGAKPVDRRRRDVARRRQQMGVGELALARRVEDADLDRPDRPDAPAIARRPPGPRRPPGRRASCSRPGAAPRGRLRAAPRWRRPPRASRRAASRRRPATPASRPARIASPCEPEVRTIRRVDVGAPTGARRGS